MGKKKRKIHRPFDDEDDDENWDFNGFPFFGGGDDSEDFSGYFQDILKKLMKQFKGKDFMNFSKNLFKQMGIPEPSDENEGNGDRKGPFVYGFSIKFGPDGKPIFDKFGDIRPIKPPINVNGIDADEKGSGKSQFVREPIADIIDQDNEILVVIELPGVTKEDIQLRATEFTLEITAESSTRNYHKRLELPGKINPDIAKARYTNGILEIKMQKVGEREKKQSNIPIE